MMNILVACEESQRVCKAFRDRGHNAFSCDIEEPSGGHPEWHILGDVRWYVNKEDFYNDISFETMDHSEHVIDEWDMIIAFPPCTYLSSAATSRHSLKVHTLEEINRRTNKRINSMNFFMIIATADCDKIAIENPVGVMNTAYRKPDQIIEPYRFGEPYKKRTCLWLKGLPPLKPTKIVEPIGGSWVYKDRSPTNRSKTFEGIASAMAEQWG